MDTVTLGFVSTNPGVVQVDGSGRATAVAAGDASVVVSALCCTSSDTVPVVVRPTQSDPVPAEMLLTVDWGTATGNSRAAVTDGDRGLSRWCAWDNVLNVVPGSTVGWTRTANALSIRSIQSCGHVEFENLFPLPRDGEEQYWAVSYYVMNGVGQTDTKMHRHGLSSDRRSRCRS